MKKQLAKVLVSVFSVAMCLGFAACGEGDSSSAEEEKTPSAEEIVGVEVTAEQWKAAFEYLQADNANYTVNDETKSVMEITDYPYSQVEGGKISGIATLSGTTLAKKNGTKEYVKSVITVSADEPVKTFVLKIVKENSEQYFEKTADGNFLYEQKEGKWEKTSSNVSIMKEFTDNFEEVKFDKSTFSEEKKGYVLNEEGMDWIIKFNEDAKIVTLILKSSYVMKTGIYMTGEETCTITYDAVEITLPTVEE